MRPSQKPGVPASRCNRGRRHHPRSPRSPRWPQAPPECRQPSAPPTAASRSTPNGRGELPHELPETPLDSLDPSPRSLQCFGMREHARRADGSTSCAQLPLSIFDPSPTTLVQRWLTARGRTVHRSSDPSLRTYPAAQVNQQTGPASRALPGSQRHSLCRLWRAGIHRSRRTPACRVRRARGDGTFDAALGVTATCDPTTRKGKLAVAIPCPAVNVSEERAVLMADDGSPRARSLP